MNIILDLEKHFLGKLCKHNHDWENSGFSLRTINGNQCVICKSEYARIYREANKERIAEYSRIYNQENADKVRERTKRAYDLQTPEYREKRRLQSRTYKEANREKILKQKKEKYYRNRTVILEKHRDYLKKNCDKVREYNKKYGQTPEGKNAYLTAKEKRRAAKNKCHSLPYKREDILNLCNGECAYCGSKAKLSLDHFIPISKGGSNVQGNLLPACLSCNCSKNDKDVIEWYKSQSFFNQKRWKQILKILGKTESNYDQIPLF